MGVVKHYKSEKIIFNSNVNHGTQSTKLMQTKKKRKPDGSYGVLSLNRIDTKFSYSKYAILHEYILSTCIYTIIYAIL